MSLSKIEEYYKGKLEYIQREISNRNKNKSILLGLLIGLLTLSIKYLNTESPIYIIYALFNQRYDIPPDTIFISILVYYFILILILELINTEQIINHHEKELIKYFPKNKTHIISILIRYSLYFITLGASIYLLIVDYPKVYLEKQTDEKINKLKMDSRKDYKFCHYENALKLFEKREKGVTTKTIQIDNLIYKCIRDIKTNKEKTLQEISYKTFLIGNNGQETDLNFDLNYTRKINNGNFENLIDYPEKKQSDTKI